MLDAAAEFTRPLIGSSAATSIIFAPLAFLSGVTGAFFKALSLTMAASLIISFLIAWIALPIIATRLLSVKDARLDDSGKLTRAIHAWYQSLMTRLLRNRLWVVVLILPLVLVGFLAFKNVQSGFMPTMDEGGFIIDYRAAPGSSLAETDRLVRQVEAILKILPEVQTYSRRTGLGLGGDLNESNQGDFFVRLRAGPRRGIEEIMDDVRTQVEHGVPGLAIETAQLMEDLIGDLTSVPQPIEIKIFSDDEATLQTGAGGCPCDQLGPRYFYCVFSRLSLGTALGIALSEVKNKPRQVPSSAPLVAAAVTRPLWRIPAMRELFLSYSCVS